MNIFKRFMIRRHCRKRGHDVSHTLVREGIQNKFVKLDDHSYVALLPARLHCNYCGDDRIFYSRFDAEEFILKNPNWRPCKLTTTIRSMKEYEDFALSMIDKDQHVRSEVQ